MSDKYLSQINKLIFTDSLAIVILLLFFCHSVQAQVYKCENDAGQINFSDEPCAKDETSSRLNWLNNTVSPKKKNKSAAKRSSQANKTAIKARKNNEAYVLLSLKTTTRLELETASLRSFYEGQESQAPELILPDGVIVDLLKMDRIIFTSQYGKESIKARFVMADGYEEIKQLKAPYPVISGEAKIGRFSKSLEDIKLIEFFNSKKLLKVRADKAGKKPLASPKLLANKKQTNYKHESAKVDKDVPVIELDLSSEVVTEKKSTAGNEVKPRIKVIDKKTGSRTQAKTSDVQVLFVNDTKTILKNTMLASTKGSQKSRAQYFIVSDKIQFPYNEIKRIKIRPTANKSSLLVAIELKTKEIKMEVMSPPFTRIIGQSHAGRFDHSLLEIKSISFP